MGSSVLADAYTYGSTNPELASFVVIDEAFRDILGDTASISLIYNASEPLFHEGAVYIAESDALYVSSNRIQLPEGVVDESTSNQTIKLSVVSNVSADNTSSITIDVLDTAGIPLPNGGILTTDSGLLWCSQGTRTTSGGIFTIPDPVNAPNQSFPVVTSFFGLDFNGPNDVVTFPGDDHRTIWFTDVDYTVTQGLRDVAEVKNHVYLHDPVTNSTRAVADGFEKPNGLAFNADGSTLYVTDANKDADTNPQGASGIYAYDVLTSPGPFLANKRLFAYAPLGIPDGLKVDSKGNVWAGTGAGVVVWDENGTVLGEIAVEGGSANFGFGKSENEVFVLGEKHLWRVQLSGN